MLAEQTGHLLVELTDLLLEELQLLQHHLQQSSVHGLELRARRPSASHNCSGEARKFRSAKVAKAVGLVSPSAQRFQHAPGTGAQQIRDQAGQLNVGLFQKRLQLALQPHSVARQLVLSGA